MGYHAQSGVIPSLLLVFWYDSRGSQLPKRANKSATQPVPDTHLQIVYWPIARLTMYANNPRKNDGVVDRMCQSIKEYGFAVPVLARADGTVVDGHLRVKAGLKMGIAEVPVIVCDKWTEAQVKAFRLMANRSVTWAEWDMEKLVEEMKELAAMDLDLSLTGFDDAEFVVFMTGLNGDAKADANKTLAERFGVPPFSVLDARQGYWQERKAAWLALGIQSELGRGGASEMGAAVPGEGGRTAIYRKGPGVKYAGVSRPIEAL